MAGPKASSSSRYASNSASQVVREAWKPSCQPQRPDREADNCIQREADHLGQRVLGFAGETGRLLMMQRRLAETDLADLAANDAVLFRHAIQHVKRAG